MSLQLVESAYEKREKELVAEGMQRRSVFKSIVIIILPHSSTRSSGLASGACLPAAACVVQQKARAASVAADAIGVGRSSRGRSQ